MVCSSPDHPETWEAAYGNEATARCAVVWIGATKGNLQLFAVVAPRPIRSAGPRSQLDGPAARIYIEDIAEARRVAGSLGGLCAP